MTTCFCKAGEGMVYRQPVSIECPRGYEPRALPAAPCRLILLRLTSSLTIYRQPVSIECPRSYEPRALPLRHAGECFVLRVLSCVCCLAGRALFRYPLSVIRYPCSMLHAPRRRIFRGGSKFVS